MSHFPGPFRGRHDMSETGGDGGSVAGGLATAAGSPVGGSAGGGSVGSPGGVGAIAGAKRDSRVRRASPKPKPATGSSSGGVLTSLAATTTGGGSRAGDRVQLSPHPGARQESPGGAGVRAPAPRELAFETPELGAEFDFTSSKGAGGGIGTSPVPPFPSSSSMGSLSGAAHPSWGGGYPPSGYYEDGGLDIPFDAAMGSSASAVAAASTSVHVATRDYGPSSSTSPNYYDEPAAPLPPPRLLPPTTGPVTRTTRSVSAGSIHAPGGGKMSSRSSPVTWAAGSPIPGPGRPRTAASPVPASRVQSNDSLRSAKEASGFLAVWSHRRDGSIDGDVDFGGDKDPFGFAPHDTGPRPPYGMRPVVPPPGAYYNDSLTRTSFSSLDHLAEIERQLESRRIAISMKQQQQQGSRQGSRQGSPQTKGVEAGARDFPSATASGGHAAHGGKSHGHTAHHHAPSKSGGSACSGGGGGGGKHGHHQTHHHHGHHHHTQQQHHQQQHIQQQHHQQPTHHNQNQHHHHHHHHHPSRGGTPPRPSVTRTKSGGSSRPPRSSASNASVEDLRSSITDLQATLADARAKSRIRTDHDPFAMWLGGTMQDPGSGKGAKGSGTCDTSVVATATTTAEGGECHQQQSSYQSHQQPSVATHHPGEPPAKPRAAHTAAGNQQPYQCDDGAAGAGAGVEDAQPRAPSSPPPHEFDLAAYGQYHAGLHAFEAVRSSPKAIKRSGPKHSRQSSSERVASSPDKNGTFEFSARRPNGSGVLGVLPLLHLEKISQAPARDVSSLSSPNRAKTAEVLISPHSAFDRPTSARSHSSEASSRR